MAHLYNNLIILFLLIFTLSNCTPTERSCKSSSKKKDNAKAHDTLSNRQTSIANSIKNSESYNKPRLDFNFQQLQQCQLDTIIVFISPMESYIATVDRISKNVNNTISVRARIKDYPAAFLLMSSTEGATEGVVRIPEKKLNFQIKSDAPASIIYLTELFEDDEIKTDILLQPPENQ